MHEQVIGPHGGASRRAIAVHRQLILPVASLLAVAAAVLLALMLINAQVLDDKAKVQSLGAMQAGIDERADQLDRVVKDYAWWNEAVEEIQNNRSRDWAEARLGAYLYGTHEYDWAFVVAPDGSTFHAADRGEWRTDSYAAIHGDTIGEDIGSALGDDLWRKLVERALTSIVNGEPMAVHTYLRMRDGGLGIGSAAAIMPETSWDKAPPLGQPYVLVVVRSLGAEWFSELAGALDIAGLVFERTDGQPAPSAGTAEASPPGLVTAETGVTGWWSWGWRSLTRPWHPVPAVLPLAGPEHTEEHPQIIGHADWQPRRPGTDFVSALAPSLGLALALFVAFGWSALRHSRTSTVAIVESEDRFRDVADASSDWIFETDADGKITWISDRFIALTGIPLGEIEGRPITDLLLPMAGEDRSDELDVAIRDRRLFRSIPRCYLDQEGRPRALRVSGKPTRDHAGLHVGWRGTATDVTVEIEARRTAEFLSGHDALTGALNRQGMLEGTTALIAAARRLGQSAGFLLLDIDRFKEVNDVHGPIVGDQLIRAVAQRLAERARPGDVVARLAADEFVLVRPAIEDAHAAQRLAKSLQDRLAEPAVIEGQEITISASVAAIMLPDEADTAERALHVAGMVMSRAKQDGRSALRFFEPGMDARLQARKALERDLAKAIDNHEFEVFYQPKMNARTRELSGVEALIRWRHPQHGLIAPGLFIPVAEETRMIAQIGRWVLEQACRDAAEWGGIQVAVNLSPAQFTDDDLLDTVAGALRATRLPAAQLEVEITEGVLLANNARSNAMMNQFVEMGVHLAMDDFGTGYSSMSYLTKFRFNKIKIDRSFVQALDRGGEAIILAIVGMTRSLGIKSCAEGIETEEQMAALRVMGIDEVQGYLFGRPMPRSELVDRFALARRPQTEVVHAAA